MDESRSNDRESFKCSFFVVKSKKILAFIIYMC